MLLELAPRSTDAENLLQPSAYRVLPLVICQEQIPVWESYLQDEKGSLVDTLEHRSKHTAKRLVAEAEVDKQLVQELAHVECWLQELRVKKSTAPQE